MKRVLGCVVLLMGLVACSEREEATVAPVPAPPAAATPAPAVDLGQALKLEWYELVPQDWQPDAAFAGLGLEEMEDDDPRVQEMMARVRQEWDKAPVIEALDGLLVKLPGFVVPLEGDGRKVESFILVPYYGACVHVPPPPANQTVYVTSTAGGEVRGLFDTVWVTGKLRAVAQSTPMAQAGYTIEALKVEPFE
ncbi:DUF3299 domain-containing protein [Sulfurivermis fontis]|uniref:DUF3299 domain-containing protein n=1 Tax=Sulfurivermis fontis TaxID=1972068 RepID=UPI00155867EE|nr:DUF3299 domain-containing protein [Sulfurivermis fontis]